jgi:hypothetical protein
MKRFLLFLSTLAILVACNPTNPPLLEIQKVRPRFVVPLEDVVITGTGFSNSSVVTIGGQTVNVTSFQTTALKVKAPNLQAGSYLVTVTSSPQSFATNKDLNILASPDNYFPDQTLVVFKENLDLNKATQIAQRASMIVADFKPAEAGATGICSNSLAVFEQQGGTSRAVDTASDIPEVLEANPHLIGTGGSYSDSGPTIEHKNEFTALELDRAYTHWKTLLPNMQNRSPRVAVLDTGVSEHYDFRNLFNLLDTNLLSGRNFTNERVNLAIPIESDTADNAKNLGGTRVGHGTAVAAIIAARDSESGTNFTQFWQVGVLPARNNNQSGPLGADGAKILPLKVCNEALQCKGIEVIKGLCYAISQQPDVINLSLGTQQPSSIVKQVIKAVTDANIVLVASAGNRGIVPQYPAAYSLELPIIAVGSVRYDSSGKYKASSFSVPGAWVSLVAPGETQSASFDPSGADGFGYRTFEGTSFAAPWVSGVAAMLKALDPSATPLEIKNKIIAGASRTNLECVPLEKCGAGLLNAANAIGAP